MKGQSNFAAQLEYITDRLDSKGATRVFMTNFVNSWAKAALANPKATPSMRTAANELSEWCSMRPLTELPRTARIVGLIYQMAGLDSDAQTNRAKLSRAKRKSPLEEAFNEVLSSNPGWQWKDVANKLSKGGVTISNGQFVEIEFEGEDRIVPIVDNKRLKPIAPKTFMQYRAKKPPQPPVTKES